MLENLINNAMHPLEAKWHLCKVTHACMQSGNIYEPAQLMSTNRSSGILVRHMVLKAFSSMFHELFNWPMQYPLELV